MADLLPIFLVKVLLNETKRYIINTSQNKGCRAMKFSYDAYANVKHGNDKSKTNTLKTSGFFR